MQSGRSLAKVSGLDHGNEIAQVPYFRGSRFD
jgi:hypothetical protein